MLLLSQLIRCARINQFWPDGLMDETYSPNASLVPHPTPFQRLTPLLPSLPLLPCSHRHCRLNLFIHTSIRGVKQSKEMQGGELGYALSG